MNIFSKMTTQIQKTPRNSNLELYRIIVMLLIVAHHSVWHSGIMPTLSQDPFCVKSIFYYVLGMWGRAGIDCFVLITGYFMCKSHITVRKYLKLLLEVVFYNIVIYGIFVGFGKQTFFMSELFFCFFPFQEIGGLFIPCFLLFYLFIPYLTIVVTHINKRMHARLIALCLCIYTMTVTLPHFQVTMNHVTWYSVLFFIASYIRNYGLFPNMSTTRWGGITLLCVLLSIASVMCVVYFDMRLGKQTSPYKYVSPSGVCAVLTSVSSFMFFKNLKLRNRHWINLIASGTFGVLLIHDNSAAMRKWLWHTLVDVKRIYALDGWSSLYLIVLVIIAIFFVCVAIDIIRKKTIEKIIFQQIDKIQ